MPILSFFASARLDQCVRPGDLGVRHPLGGQQHDPGPLREPGPQRERTHQAPQLLLVTIAKHQPPNN